MRPEPTGARAAPGRRAPKLPVGERRAQLLACALKVFARKGIAGAGHADVAAAAGVAVPTVFGYFPTRLDLLRAVVAEVERFIMDRARAAASGRNTASEQLIAVLRGFTDSFETDPEYLTIWVNWATAFHEEVWPLYLAMVESVKRFHRDIIGAAQARGELSDDVDPAMSAYLVIGASTVIIQMKIAGEDPESITRYLETTIHGALHQN